MSFRGVANSTFKFAFYNEKLLKNKSIIFFEKNNHRNEKEVIKKFKKYFKVISISNFLEIENYKNKLNIDYIYIQKSGEKDEYKSNKIKTLVHAMYPQTLTQVHGHAYAYVSEWLSDKFSNKKINFIPYIVENYPTTKNLKKILKIKKKQIVFGCHGGSSSFDLNFVKKTIIKVASENKNIIFLFLNIDKFAKLKNIIFLKGTFNEIYKRKFLNTCDAMIYGRSLGESFGLACAEFAILGKKIISYKYNRHRNHIFSLSKKFFVEYNSFQNLERILTNFKKNKFTNLNSKQIKHLDYKPSKVMKKFKDIFLNNYPKKNVTILDNFLNLIQYILMCIRYIKHKLYYHFYNNFY